MSGLRGVLIRACDAGLANPGPVAAALWTDPELEAGVQLDGIVAVADARHLPRQLAAHPATHNDGGGRRGPSGASSGPNEAQQQLAYADVVLLNKACASMPVIAAACRSAVSFSCDRCYLRRMQLRCRFLPRRLDSDRKSQIHCTYPHPDGKMMQNTGRRVWHLAQGEKRSAPAG